MTLLAIPANLSGKRKSEDDLETKPVLKKKSEKETTKGSVELLETKSDQETVEGLYDVVEEASVPKKTLFVAQLAPQTEISDIIDFFQDVGEVVRVRLVVNEKCFHRCCGFVEFASANEANKALQKKNGEYLHDRKIFLDDVATERATYLTPKYCIDHQVWYKDYLQRESLPRKKDETPPDFVEEVLFVANLSPQTTKISDIIDFFQDVGEVVSVRLVVNGQSKHVGYGFVEFVSANKAKRALEKKNGEYLHDHKILLMKGLYETPDPVEAAAVRNKTLFVAHFKRQIEISHIIDFFKDVGEVVHVRLMVDPQGRHVGCCHVEFASANEAQKALQKKNGEYLHNCKILVDVKTASCSTRPKYCIDHNVRYEDYLRRESLLIKEDAAVEGLDETPDFDEEVAVRKKTLFVANLSDSSRISNIINFFKDVGELVRVRLIVDHRGERVGCGFVEFASANEAKKALKKKNGGKIFLDVPEIAPYPFRPKYNLAERLWYEDCLRRFSLNFETEISLWCGKKTVFSDDD